DLRRYLRTEFFDFHLRNYSKSHRSAPLYVPLSTQSSEFIVWLNAHRVMGDTLFMIQSELLSQKVRLEEGRVAAARADRTGGRKQGRKADREGGSRARGTSRVRE